MAFWDLFKGLFEGIIKIEDNRVIDNRKIIITNSSITIGDQVINNPELVDKFFEKLSESKNKESLPLQVVHKDISKTYFEYETISKEEAIEKLKRILPEYEIEIIMMAYRVKNEYDTADIITANNSKGKLISKFHDKGCKVLDLVCGGYFEEIVIPFIDIFKSEDPKNYASNFRKFYSDLIKFFPLAFFVSNKTDEKMIKEEINKRLKLSVPFVRLHAINKFNIDKLNKCLDDLKISENYNISTNSFTCSNGLKAQISEIKLKK